MRVALCLLAVSLATGCSYDEEKAMREYQASLDPVRPLISQLQRYQPRINDRRGAQKSRQYITTEVLPRARAILATLETIQPRDPKLSALHQRLVGNWAGYVDAFQDYVEDLTDRNLSEKRDRMESKLSQISLRMRSFNVDAEALHETVSGWGG